LQPNGAESRISNTARCCGRVCRVEHDVEGFGLLRGVMVDWRRKRFFVVARLDFGEMDFGEGDHSRVSQPAYCVFFRMAKWAHDDSAALVPSCDKAYPIWDMLEQHCLCSTKILLISHIKSLVDRNMSQRAGCIDCCYIFWI